MWTYWPVYYGAYLVFRVSKAIPSGHKQGFLPSPDLRTSNNRIGGEMTQIPNFIAFRTYILRMALFSFFTVAWFAHPLLSSHEVPKVVSQCEFQLIKGVGAIIKDAKISVEYSSLHSIKKTILMWNLVPLAWISHKSQSLWFYKRKSKPNILVPECRGPSLVITIKMRQNCTFFFFSESSC